MAEYIDLDDKIVVTDIKGRERETTVRNILDFNNGTYHAADVVPVRYGRWTGHDIGNGRLSIDEDTCSLCGSRFYQIAETGCDWNYCPNCGARMEES